MEQEEVNSTTTTETTSTDSTPVADTSKVASESTATTNEEDTTDVDVEFDDDEEETANPTPTEAKPTQQEQVKRETRNERNSRYAKARREGMLEALDHINPYTNSKMETDKDLEIYENMKAMEKAGLDPNNTTDYINFITDKENKANAEKIAQEEQRKALEKSANDRMSKELAEFNTKYPNINLENWVSDKANALQSKAFAGLLRSGMSALESYETVQSLYNAQTFDSAQKIAKQTVQNNMASPGSQTDGEEKASVNDVSHMTDKQFKAYWQKRFG